MAAANNREFHRTPPCNSKNFSRLIKLKLLSKIHFNRKHSDMSLIIVFGRYIKIYNQFKYLKFRNFVPYIFQLTHFISTTFIFIIGEIRNTKQSN